MHFHTPLRVLIFGNKKNPYKHLNGHNRLITQILIKRVELLPYRELLHKQNKSSSHLNDILVRIIILHVSNIHMSELVISVVNTTDKPLLDISKSDIATVMVFLVLASEILL